MRLREVMRLLDCEAVWGGDLADEVEIGSSFAADLMSDVLAYSKPGALLLTGLTSPQSAHTADVADMAAVLYVAGKRPAPGVLGLACETRIPLLSTKHSMFDACGILYEAGIRAAHRV